MCSQIFRQRQAQGGTEKLGNAQGGGGGQKHSQIDRGAERHSYKGCANLKMQSESFFIIKEKNGNFSAPWSKICKKLCAFVDC